MVMYLPMSVNCSNFSSSSELSDFFSSSDSERLASPYRNTHTPKELKVCHESFVYNNNVPWGEPVIVIKGKKNNQYGSKVMFFGVFFYHHF